MNQKAPNYKKKTPDGWKWVRLETLIPEVQSGFACGERDPNGLIQLRMNNVDTRGNFVWDEFIRVPADEATIAQYRLEPKDVLFNNTNSVELVGKSALFKGHSEPVVFSNHFTRLRTDGRKLLPDFLSAWLNHQWNQGVFASICNRWIGQSAVKPGKLLALDFPLPPIDEQKRIAAILNEQMAIVERARWAAGERCDSASALPTAILRSIFGAPQDTPWLYKRLSDLASLLPSKSIASAGDAEVVAVTTACLSEAGFLPDGVKRARMKAEHVEDCTVHSGEVLVARSNTSELVGRVSMYQGEPPGIVASDLTIRVWTDDRIIRSAFLAAYLAFLYQSGFWRERAGGASGSMKKITRSQLLCLEVPVPALAEQDAVLRRIGEQLPVVRTLLESAREELDVIDSMPAALMRMAFSGTR